jgi:hypothetical protein
MGGSMSSIVIFGNTSGSITLDTPAVAGTNTIILPAQTGTAVVADNLGNVSVTGNASVTGNLSFNSGYGSSSLAYGCRAWVNFNGSGTPAIRASGNINSITDNGAGNYSISFTNPLVDANYSVTGIASDTGGVGNRGLVSLYRGLSDPNTSSFRIFTFTDTTQTDNTFICLSVFR